MANITFIEKSKLEDLFEMNRGYVLDFSDRSFAEFFSEMRIGIDDPKYAAGKPSDSKANRLRGFWEQENDKIVGTAIEKMIEYAEHLGSENKESLIFDCRNIANQLTGKPQKTKVNTSEAKFLSTDFGEIDLSKLPVESQLQNILENRLTEAQICLKNGANLATIFMAGSLLEGALLGAAQKYPQQFNRSLSCPKERATKKPKVFAEWKLSEFIDVGRDINLLGEDVKIFSHALRDFRNYIHPYQQMAADFKPDEDTAKICLQVLKAALTDLIENRPS